MCLFSVRRDEDIEPVRIHERRTYVNRHQDRTPVRASRVSVHSTQRVPAPNAFVVPPPQPVPVFVNPPTPPPAVNEAHYVTVSPRSSSDDSYYRREVKVERDYSPARSHSRRRSRSRSRARDDYETFRYVEPPRASRSRSRHRSRSRYDDDVDFEYRRTRERYYD